MLECDRILYVVMCVTGWCRLNTLSPLLPLCINQCNYLIFNFKQLPLWSSSCISFLQAHDRHWNYFFISQGGLPDGRNYIANFGMQLLCTVFCKVLGMPFNWSCSIQKQNCLPKKLFLILCLQHFLEWDFINNIVRGQILTYFWATWKRLTLQTKSI